MSARVESDGSVYLDGWHAGLAVGLMCALAFGIGVLLGVLLW
jgi:hypothetical protein